MVLTQHCNFRTVISQFAPNTTIGFPVSSQIDQQLTLATRTGASSNGVVVAVGSGSVMDLAKATTVMKQTTTAAAAAAAATDDRSVQRPLLLVPATYGAVLAAASPHALLFDTSEQAIVVAESPSSSSSPTIPTTTTTVATLEAARMDPRGRSAAIYAALALALDRLWQQQGTANKDNNKAGASTLAGGDCGIELSSLLSILCSNLSTDHPAQASQQQQHEQEQNHQHVVQALLSTGANLSFGRNGTQNRSIPLTLATSLVPQHFADHPCLTVMASLAPPLLELVLENPFSKALLEKALLLTVRSESNNHNHDEEPAIRTVAQLERVVTTGAPRLVTNHSLDDLLAAVRDNQFLWNSYDVSEHILRRVLRDHVLLV